MFLFSFKCQCRNFVLFKKVYNAFVMRAFKIKDIKFDIVIIIILTFKKIISEPENYKTIKKYISLKRKSIIFVRFGFGLRSRK